MRTLDLFAGCGGMSLGFQHAGFKVIAAFDNWEPAIKVYRHNFNHPIYNYDLATLNGNYDQFRQYEPELIIGGPPCQDFSSAGKRDEKLGRADLTINFAKIVVSLQPAWFVMENVNLAQRSQRYHQAMQLFRQHGYGLTLRVLNAAYYGVPQNRKRCFLVGRLGAYDEFLGSYLDKKLLSRPMTVRQYWDKMGQTLDVEHIYRHPRSYQRRGIFSIDEPSPTVRGVNRPIPKTYQRHKNDTASPTDMVRPLTTIERSYVQTFPPNFVFTGSKTNLEQMIGNAVPVKLAEFVASCIKQYDQQRYSTIDQLPVDHVQQLPLFGI
ncbi:DNA cytosine methyltransferase [Anaerolineales bacterium HSG25]|nr:DNA cytosine methyltransferase [Anaerolineales bacterium HSG25]